jgi:salicylate hydroxylase
MLPFGGQGANQAIEDGGALGVLLAGMSSVEDLPRRLALFEKVRRLRASRVQMLSTVRLGKEKDVEQEVKKYSDFPGQGKRFFFLYSIGISG